MRYARNCAGTIKDNSQNEMQLRGQARVQPTVLHCAGFTKSGIDASCLPSTARSIEYSSHLGNLSCRIFSFPAASTVAASHNVKISTFIIQATAQVHVHKPKINEYASSKISPNRR